MPQPATHYWVVRRSIPEDSWETWWDIYKSYFGLGTAAPDLFYFPLMPGVKISCKDFYWDGIADLIHHSRSYDIFCSLLDYAKKRKKDSIENANKQFAFAFGYYCHVITDCIFHPYVYQSTGDRWAKKVYSKKEDPSEYKHELAHKYQEFLIDQGIYEEYNIKDTTSLDRISWKCFDKDENMLDTCIAEMFCETLIENYPDCFPKEYNNPNDINHPVQQAYSALMQTADLLFQGKEIFLFGGKLKFDSISAKEVLLKLDFSLTDGFFIEPYPDCGGLKSYSPSELFNFACGVARKIFLEALNFWDDQDATNSKNFFAMNFTHYLNQGNWNLDTGLKCDCNNLEMLYKDNESIGAIQSSALNEAYCVFESNYYELFK